MSNKRTYIAVGLGVAIGAVVAIGLGSLRKPTDSGATGAATASTIAPRPLFWGSVPPDQWREALKRPDDHRPPNFWTNDQMPMLLENLARIEEILHDEELPSQSRFGVGGAIYVLGMAQLRAKEYAKYDEADKRLLRASIKGLQVMYTIANTVNPLDGLQSVHNAIVLVKPASAEELRQRLADHGWTVDEVTARDAFVR